MGCQISRNVERYLYQSEFPKSSFELSFDTAQSATAVDALTAFTLLFIKLTFFLLYFQVFRPLRWLRITVYIGATLTCAFYGVAFIVQMIFTVPRPGQKWLDHISSEELSKSEVLSIPLAAVGLGIDIALLVIPITAVMGLQLSIKRKLGVMFIFTFGIL